MNQAEPTEPSRRVFLRSASLGLASTVIAGSFPAVAFGEGQEQEQEQDREGLSLVEGPDAGCFSIRYGPSHLIENVHWQIECEGSMILSTGGRYRVERTGTALRFTDSQKTCDVNVSWNQEEGGSLLVFSFSVMNTSEGDLRIKNIYPMISGKEPGAGLFFWQPGNMKHVLTDEWERCYGLAGVQDAEAETSIQSAWDLHLFDREKSLCCTLSYLQIPNSKVSFTLGRLDQQRSSLTVRCDIHSGKRGVLVGPGESFDVHELMVRMGQGSCFTALEGYSRVIARRNGIKPPPIIPVGWVDWYFAKATSTEDDVLRNLDFIADELKDYGLEYVQIDSGWQLGVETTPPPHNVIAGGPWIPNSKFPRGMKWFADEIRKRGLKPGIWIRPFHSIDGSPERMKHPEWFNEKGQMDFSHQEVRAEVERLISLLTDEWGFEYIKYDFPSYDLFDAWGPALFEDHSAHKETHDSRKTNIVAYSEAIDGIAAAARGKAYLLACNSVMPVTIGKAEVFRIGDDVGDWARTFQYGVKSVSSRYYTNGVFWTNDPDCLLVREPFTVDQARMWASLISLSGGAVFVSENLPKLPSERLQIIKKAMPVYKNSGSGYSFGRPVDLLENDPPTTWDFEIQRPFASWHVVGLFNWSENEATRTIDFGMVGLPGQTPIHLVDFWKNQYLGTYRKSFSTSLPPMSCQVLAVHRVKEHPHIVSSSRHILQGAVETLESGWNEQALTLNGTSRAIKNNPYEVMIFAGDRSLRDVRNALLLESPEQGILRLRISSEHTSDVEWSVSFNPQ